MTTLKNAVCKGCGGKFDYEGPTPGGRVRAFCSTACRRRIQRDADRAGYEPRPPRVLTCGRCRNQFEYQARGAPRMLCKACSECQCQTCGKAFTARWNAKRGRSAYCSLACRPQVGRRLYATKKEQRSAQRHRRRVRFKGQPAERFARREIFERDGWVCGICHGPVDPTLKSPHMQAASIDHVVPVALGGAHTRSNAQCAHFLCNSLKAHRVEPPKGDHSPRGLHQ